MAGTWTTAKLIPDRRRGPAERLETILADLAKRLPDLKGSAIADKSGLPIASALPPNVNLLMVTAMSALAIQSAASIHMNLGLSPTEIHMMRSKDSVVIVRPVAGGSASLIVVLGSMHTWEEMRDEVEKTAKEVDEVLVA